MEALLIINHVLRFHTTVDVISTADYSFILLPTFLEVFAKISFPHRAGILGAVLCLGRNRRLECGLVDPAETERAFFLLLPSLLMFDIDTFLSTGSGSEIPMRAITSGLTKTPPSNFLVGPSQPRERLHSDLRNCHTARLSDDSFKTSSTSN